MSTADATSAAEPSPRAVRPSQRFGRIVVVGGGCYGGYYVRQLLRAERASAVGWESLVVVDHDPDCAVTRLPLDARPPGLVVVIADWHAYFDAYLEGAASDPTRRDDAIVPSPLMPHLLADWLVARARARWPRRVIRTLPLERPPAVPWHRAGDDGTHYVSFAEWMCPINCVEPARCPHTRGERSWSLPVAVRAYAQEEQNGERAIEPLVFHCAHRAYGVGMIDVRDVLDADAAMAALGGSGETSFLIGTVSHCHGALRRVSIGEP